MKTSPPLRKGGTSRFKRLTEHQTIRTRTEIPPDIIKALNIENKKEHLKLQKRKDRSQIKTKRITDFSTQTLNARRS
jgi:hypothetical protein